MANNHNLKPLNMRPQRERKEIARKGAEASNRVQANKRALREAAKTLLAMPVNDKVDKQLRDFGLPQGKYDYAVALVVSQIKNALQGDTKAFNAVRDVIGESPFEARMEEPETERDIIINILPASAMTEDD